MSTRPVRGDGQLRLLPDPDRPYAALRDDLVRLGWEWANESQELPLLPGEPEWVLWTHPSGSVLEYEFLPPVGLRTIVGRGSPDVLALLLDLPRLHMDDVAALLDAGGSEPTLRGLLAVRAMRWLPLLGRVHQLHDHPDDLVRRVADDVASHLPGEAVTETWDRLRALRERNPGRSVLLGLMPVEDRRQVLRWMGVDVRTAGTGVLEALRSGLADDDAEVRVTAALVAARLGVREVRGLVDDVRTPAVFDRPLALARAALDGRTPLRSPSGDPPGDDDDTLLLSLLEPVPIVPAPQRLPSHLTGDGAVRLRRTGLPAALVPSVPHRLRAAADGGPGPQVHRPQPFVVTVAPVDAGTARMLGLRAPEGADSAPFLATQEEAEELAVRLSDLEGAPLDVVTADRWEAGLRGPDGRRFTAGNEAPAIAVSPWGVLAVPGVRERLAGGLAADCADLARVEPVTPDVRLPVRVAGGFPL